MTVVLAALQMPMVKKHLLPLVEVIGFRYYIQTALHSLSVKRLVSLDFFVVTLVAVVLSVLQTSAVKMTQQQLFLMVVLEFRCYIQICLYSFFVHQNLSLDFYVVISEVVVLVVLQMVTVKMMQQHLFLMVMVKFRCYIQICLYSLCVHQHLSLDFYVVVVVVLVVLQMVMVKMMQQQLFLMAVVGFRCCK